MSACGMLVVISAPSGTGKGTIISRLMERDPNLCLSISATTRAMRPGDADGVTYNFITEDAFERMISEDAFLEYAGLYGRRYGTPRANVEKLLCQGRDVLLEIDTQGGVQLMQREKALSIFILPPSMAELKRRLEQRGTETAEQVARRVAFAYEELKNAQRYQYCVLNDDVAEAERGIAAILRVKRGAYTNNDALLAQRLTIGQYSGHIKRLLEEKA